jgi:toxin ParE1/3/4
MVRPVVYSARARTDILEIWTWLAENSGVPVGDLVLDRIEKRISELSFFPEMGPRRPDIDEAARMLVVQRWLVLYAVDEDAVRIIRIIDGSADLRGVQLESE